MQFHRLWPALLAAGLAACSDRPAAPTALEETATATDPAVVSGGGINQARLERLARRTARALRDPSFRADVKATLDRSTHREGKVHFQRYLESNGRRALRVLASADGEPESDVLADASQSGALEMYFPVPGHRAAWAGGENVLVATAQRDGEAPVAYALAGRRIVLSPDTRQPRRSWPSSRRSWTDAPRRWRKRCAPRRHVAAGRQLRRSVDPGLYMTRAEFVESFESWLKGIPSEIHVMGPAARATTRTWSRSSALANTRSASTRGTRTRRPGRQPAPVLEAQIDAMNVAQGRAVHDHGLRG
jgi:hypothetical protein